MLTEYELLRKLQALSNTLKSPAGFSKGHEIPQAIKLVDCLIEQIKHDKYIFPCLEPCDNPNCEMCADVQRAREAGLPIEGEELEEKWKTK